MESVIQQIHEIQNRLMIRNLSKQVTYEVHTEVEKVFSGDQWETLVQHLIVTTGRLSETDIGLPSRFGLRLRNRLVALVLLPFDTNLRLTLKRMVV